METNSSFVEGVQSTSQDALKMKISAVGKKYYQDSYITQMENKKNHKNFLPIINRGTWSRVYSILNSVEKIFNSLQENNPETKINIINLGCGLDTTYFILKEKYPELNFSFIEFDYAEVTSKKIELIKKSKVLQEVIDQDSSQILFNKTNLFSKNYFLIDCEITNSDNILSSLGKIPELDLNSLTIVIAECLLVYLSKEVCLNLLTTLTTNFKNLIFFEYDLIGANDNFGKEMVLNLLERNVRLAGYEDTPDVSSQTQRFLQSGFTHAEVCDMLEFYTNHIDKKEKIRIEQLEFVDEFEEWNLLQKHACFGYGVKLQDEFEYLYNILKFN